MRQLSIDQTVNALRWTAWATGALGLLALVYAIRAGGSPDTLLMDCTLVVAVFGIPTALAAIVALRMESKAAKEAD